MRIFIGTVEVCQWIRLLSDALLKQGHQVISYAEKETFFEFENYTLRPGTLVQDYLVLRTGNRSVARMVYFFYQALNKLSVILLKKPLLNYATKRIKKYLYKNTDIYIQLWAGLEKDDSDLKEFKKHGAKIITWFVGSDIRDYDVFKKDFGMDFFEIPQQYQSDLKKKLTKLRTHELLSDAIFSVPDQSSLALKPYLHLQIPLETEKYEFRNTHNKIPVIIHIPSNPQIKGSAVIERAIHQLKKEGLEFNYISKAKIPHTEVMLLLKEADILIDELVLHGPGVLGFEAMLCGCAVATRYYTNSPECFRPPVVAIDENTIVDTVRKLIVDYDYRNGIIEAGRKYAVENNSAAEVATKMLNALDGKTYDYYPSYFRNKFLPRNEEDTRLCNSLTDTVKQEIWYREHVKQGMRDHLVF